MNGLPPKRAGRKTLLADLRLLEEEKLELVAALNKFGGHTDDCLLLVPGCSCGFSAALAKARGES